MQYKTRIPWRTSLGWRLTIALVGMVLVFLGLLGLLSYRAVYARMAEQVRHTNLRLAVAAAQDISSRYDAILQQAHQLRGQLAGLGDAFQARILLEFRRSDPFTYRAAYIFDDQGRILVHLADPVDSLMAIRDIAALLERPRPAPPSYALAAWEKASGGALYVSPVRMSEADIVPVVDLAFPVPGASGGLTRTVVIEVDLRSIWLAVDKISVGPLGRAVVVSPEGIIIAHPDRSYVGLAAPPEILPVLAGFEGQVEYTDTRSGQRMLASYSPISRQSGWGIVIEQEQAAALAPAYGIASYTLIIAAFASVLAMLVAVIVARSITDPISRFVRVVQDIAHSGDLSRDVHVESEDEVGQLARAFNQMLASLRQAAEARRASEERLRALVENVTDIIMIMDADHIIRYASPSAERVLGYKPEETLGLDAFTLVHPDDLSATLAGASRILQNPDEPQRLEHRLRHRDGSWRTVETVGKGLRVGGELYIVVSSRDVTEHRRAEEAVRASEQRHRLFARLTSDFAYVFGIDAGGRPVLEWMSDVSQWMATYASTELQALPDLFVGIHPDDRATVLENYRRNVAGEATAFEMRIVTKDGTVRWVRNYTQPMWDTHHSRVIAIYGAAKDITEQKQAEEEVRRLNAELEQRVRQRTAELEAVNKELESFAYSVSHDLRAPLRALDGFSSMLLSRYGSQLDEQGQHYLNRIREAAQRMGQLIEDLLMLSRVTRGEMCYQTVDLSALARGAAADLRAQEPQRQVEIQIADGMVVRGDGRLLRIALENLIGNAWKFTRPRAVARIEIGMRQEDGESVYFVRDNGVGFDMAYADKLFAPFQRLHGTHEFPGTGIGLATVQRIVQRHGGQVWAEAAVDQGATFYFSLPSGHH